MRRFITFVAVAVGVIALFGLASALLTSVNEPPSKSIRSGPSEATSTTITVESSSGAVAWGRLRWLLAGLSLSAIALVSVRQISVAAAPKFPSQRRRRGSIPRPASERPGRAYELPAPRWIPDGSHASIGD